MRSAQPMALTAADEPAPSVSREHGRLGMNQTKELSEARQEVSMPLETQT